MRFVILGHSYNTLSKSFIDTLYTYAYNNKYTYNNKYPYNKCSHILSFNIFKPYCL